MFPWIATPKGLKVSKVDSEFNSLLLVSTPKTEIVSQDSHPKVSKMETKTYSKQQAVKHEMPRPTVPTARRPNPHWWGTATPWRGCSIRPLHGKATRVFLVPMGMWKLVKLRTNHPISGVCWSLRFTVSCSSQVVRWRRKTTRTILRFLRF